MALAEIGTFTSLAESLATVVGAGMILGAFGAGAFGLLVGWPRWLLEDNAVAWSYYGGIVATILVPVDLIFRYT